jgi:hypothetical protein
MCTEGARRDCKCGCGREEVMPEHITTAADRIADWLESVLPKDDPKSAEAVAFARHAGVTIDVFSDDYGTSADSDWVWPVPVREPAKSGAALREALLRGAPETKAWHGRRPEGLG